MNLVCLTAFAVFLLILGLTNVDAQNNKSMKGRIRIAHITADFPVTSLDDVNCEKAKKVNVDSYWSGEPAQEGRHFAARLLWSNTSLYIRFEANQTEPMVRSEKPDLTKKTLRLWERDVCEIFIAPDKADKNRYFEFEIAPTGEWIDLGIKVTPAGRETDWDYMSEMTSVAKVEKDKIMMAIKIPFRSLGKTPRSGDVWFGNLFRCVGSGLTRGYLAWRPTKTPEPNFHVPSAFGELIFTK